MTGQNAFTMARQRGQDTAPSKAPRKTNHSKAPKSGNVHLLLDSNGRSDGEPGAPPERHHHRKPRSAVSQRGQAGSPCGWGALMSWQAYEAAKRAWVAANPGATPEQYDAAMRAIAERLGV